MRLKSYLRRINPLLSNPEAARRLLRLLAIVLLAGILSGIYNFLMFTFNAEVSRRRGYMSTEIAEAHTFFTNREALLESLSLSAVHHPGSVLVDLAPVDEVHLQLDEWSLWLTQRMRTYLEEKRVNLLYISTGLQPQVHQLYSVQPQAHIPSYRVLAKLQKAEQTSLDELWLDDREGQLSHLFVFIRLDKRAPSSGWLGLEIDTHALSPSLTDESAGEFMMLNADGMLVFTSSSDPMLQQRAFDHYGSDFFGFVGSGWLPEYLIISKKLHSTDWKLVYSISLLDILRSLWKQLLGAIVFCLISLALTGLMIRRLEQRFITPTIQRIRALIESEMFNRDVIETAPVALCVLRRTDGKVVLENRLAQQWLGQDENNNERSRRWIRQAFNREISDFSEYFENDEGRHLYLTSAPTRYKGEEVLLCAVSDITARKQIESALEQAKCAADIANEAKTQFLATMSHEIRTPLYGVLGTLELLSRSPLGAQQRDYVQAIENSSRILLQLLCDALDLSKIESDQLEMELQEFSITGLAFEVIQGFSATAKNKGLQLSCYLDPRLPDRLMGDINRIRQILNNLLGNAVKFTDCGSVILRVKASSLDEEHSSVLWQVSDTGIGIAQEDQGHIFEPFYQTGNHTQGIPGTGLGLSICQRLTQLMDGQLSLVSSLGLGSSFTLSLPLKIAPSGDLSSKAPYKLLPERIHVVSPVPELAKTISGWLCRWGARAQTGVPSTAKASPDELLIELHPGVVKERLVAEWHGPRILSSAYGCREADHAPRIWYVNFNNLEALYQTVSRAQGMHSPDNVAMAAPVGISPLKLHILVAEDNVINQLILRDQLEKLGCTVRLAQDGAQAIQCWQRERFDLIITDVNMPHMNGYELARNLRLQGCSLPIIGATANALRGEEEFCLSAGMDRCLIKPFNLKALFDCLVPYREN